MKNFKVKGMEFWNDKMKSENDLAAATRKWKQITKGQVRLVYYLQT